MKYVVQTKQSGEWVTLQGRYRKATWAEDAVTARVKRREEGPFRVIPEEAVPPLSTVQEPECSP